MYNIKYDYNYDKFKRMKSIITLCYNIIYLSVLCMYGKVTIQREWQRVMNIIVCIRRVPETENKIKI